MSSADAVPAADADTKDVKRGEKRKGEENAEVSDQWTSVGSWGHFSEQI